MADQPPRDEKTEEATPRRLEEARERGQVAFSSESMTAATLAAAVLTIVLAGGMLAEAAGRLVARAPAAVGALGPADLTGPDFAALVVRAAREVLPAFLVLVAPIFAIAVLVGYAQVGVRVTPKAVAADPTKLDPIQGLKRIFSPRAAVRTGLAAAKVIVILAAVGLAAWGDLGRMGALAGADLGPAIGAFGHVVRDAVLAGVVAVLALSLFDFAFQRREFARDMRMTRKELKDEHKSTEGDPLVRARIRQIQREVARRRMLEDVPDATVVVTNPTHFAVALRYDPAEADAPRVVAKGAGEVAANIKRVAREAGVPIYEDPPLARALHRQVEIGDVIPADLFQAVAGVLAYVYRIQGARVEDR